MGASQFANMEGYIVGQTVPFEEDIGHEFKAGQRNPDGLILQMLPYRPCCFVVPVLDRVACFSPVTYLRT